MENIKDKLNPNFTIEQELIRCRVNIHRDDSGKLMGYVDSFIFRRADSYWIVTGKVPIKVADELYIDPVGRSDIRVNGNYGCINPRIVHNNGFITLYHIDSEIGLRVFVDVIRSHGLDKET